MNEWFDRYFEDMASHFESQLDVDGNKDYKLGFYAGITTALLSVKAHYNKEEELCKEKKRKG